MDTGVDEAFRLLGIPAASDRATVVRAYRRLARVTHPDVSADPLAAESFAHLTRAYTRALAASPAATGPARARQPVGQQPAGVRRLDEDRHAPHGSPELLLTLDVVPTVLTGSRPTIVVGPVAIRPSGAGRVKGV